MDDTAFRNLVDEVRARTDLAELIGSDVKLAPCGSSLKGHSPFSRDKDPSFVVWPHTQTWHDFSGGGSLGGDCYAYVQQRDHADFMTALRSLAARAGVPMPDAGPVDPALAAHADERRRIEAMLTMAAGYYHSALPSDVREELLRKGYGLADATIDRFQLGWADGGLFRHMTGPMGVTREDALSTGLFVRLDDGSVVDFFQGRLVFPYWKRGRAVYFIGRKTDRTPNKPWEEGKYRKLPGRSDRHPYISPLLSNDHFYNEDGVRGADVILITEGITDCLSAVQAGVACISPATTRFRRQDHERLVALTAKAGRVVICNDAETNGAGEAGAIETATVLHRAGRDVRIATLPRPAGVDKVDVNDLVAHEGPDALHRVLGAAVRLPRFLAERVPAETQKEDLAGALAPVLDLMRGASRLETEALTDLLHDRFKLAKATVKEMLRGAGGKDHAHDEGTATGEPAALPMSRKGEVFVSGGHYWTLGREGEPIIISSFTVTPTKRITVERGEVVDADLQTEGGRCFSDVRFVREAWQSKAAFMGTLPSVDLQWTGTDDNVQGVLRLVAAAEVPTFKGTLNLGYLDTPDGPRWVAPGVVLAPDGAPADRESIIYVPSGAHLHERIRLPASVASSDETDVASVVIPNLLALNHPGVVLPILGWFFAAPLRPRINRILGHFPFLMVWGTNGSGKSSVITDVFWPLVGVSSTDAFSATETEFALLKLLSSTDSTPVFIDEYKPYDMPPKRRDLLHRYLRRLYDGEVEERGRADQTLNSYRLSAPVCMAGETRPIEPALVERMIAANPAKTALATNPEFVAAMRAIKAVDVGLLAPGILRFLLGNDTATTLDYARGITDDLLEGREVPIRVRDALIVMVTGLRLFLEYAASRGVAVGHVAADVAVNAMLADLLEAGGRSVKSGLDRFLEELHVLAVQGKVQHGREYVLDAGRLALHFPSCHAAYTEHCKRIGFEGEVPDRKALRRQIDEAFRHGGYVKAIDDLVCFHGRTDRRRAVLVDLEEARAVLDVDDFPGPASTSNPRWSP